MNENLIAVIVDSGDPVLGPLDSYSIRQNNGVEIRQSQNIWGMNETRKMVLSQNAQVLIIDTEIDGFDFDNMKGFKRAFQHDNQKPITIVLLVNQRNDNYQYLTEYEGIDYDIIETRNLDNSLVLNLADRIVEQHKKNLTLFGSGAGLELSPELKQALSDNKGQEWQRSVISVYSDKGGTGKTFTSSELAVVLAGIGERDVLLLDVNQNGGHQEHAFNIRRTTKENPGIIELANLFYFYKSKEDRFRAFDEALEQKIYKDYGTPRLRVIPGISNQLQATNKLIVNENGVTFMTGLIEWARSRFDFVVIDCGSQRSNAIHHTALKLSDQVIILSDAHIGSLRDTKNTLMSDFYEGRFAKKKSDIKLVISPYQSGIDMDFNKISDYMEHKIDAVIEFDPTGNVRSSFNKGKSYVGTFVSQSLSNAPQETIATLNGLMGLGAIFYRPIAAVWADKKKGIEYSPSSKKSKKSKQAKSNPKASNFSSEPKQKKEISSVRIMIYIAALVAVVLVVLQMLGI